MSLNHILNNEANSNFDVKFNNVISETADINNINCVTINNNVPIDNICLIDEVATQNIGVVPIFEGSGNKITSSNILIDNDGLNISGENVKNCNSYELIGSTGIYSADSGESYIKADNTANISFKSTQTELNKPLKADTQAIYAKNIRSSENLTTFSELNMRTFRTRLSTNLNDGLYMVASDGLGGELSSFYFSNNNYAPRMTIFTNNQYNINNPHINNGGTYGISFDDSTNSLTLCNNTQERIKIGTSFNTHTASRHEFYGQIHALNGFFGSVGNLECQSLTITQNAYARIGFHSPISATTGYDLTNILTVAVATENTWYKILLNSNVSGTPSVLTNEFTANAGGNFTSGDITVNATGTYSCSVTVSMRKSTATGSRFILLGIGINGAQPSATVGRLVCSASSNVDDWNNYSATNILSLNAFNSYGLWVSLIDLGGAAVQNILIGDLSTSIIKLG